MIADPPIDHIAYLSLHQVERIRRVFNARCKAANSSPARRDEALKILRWLDECVNRRRGPSVGLRESQAKLEKLATGLMGTASGDLGIEILKQLDMGD